MLSQLKAESESFLEHNSHISRAVLSSLDAAILSTEEISDVFDYLQMQNLMVQPDGRYRFYDASAAYAGFNRGLCQSYTKPYECQEEELKFSSEVLLHLDFSDAALSMTRIKLTKAMNWGPTRAFVIPDLGFAAVEQRKQALFEEIGERIRIFVQNYIPQITSLILTGTAASDQRFVDAVKGALLDLISVETMESFIIHVNTASDTDLIFATAKGAAEVAKRSQEGPVRCEWSDGCKKTLAQIRNYTNVERLEL
jgi:hypothetical protein